MKVIIALVSNHHDTYDRHWIRNCGEDKDQFINRMKKCYPEPDWHIDFYEAEEID